VFVIVCLIIICLKYSSHVIKPPLNCAQRIFFICILIPSIFAIARIILFEFPGQPQYSPYILVLSLNYNRDLALILLLGSYTLLSIFADAP